ncbi:hypothetical protein NHH82_01950 [Oxalobacteraceae bacterium OTU3REALA1]|nr:hypothetical protein NHH82_01950 [Oxalobacteraceae bacterium OTU3REALA1]
MNQQDEDTVPIVLAPSLSNLLKRDSIMPLRHKSATSRVYIVEGTVTPPSH